MLCSNGFSPHRSRSAKYSANRFAAVRIDRVLQHIVIAGLDGWSVVSIDASATRGLLMTVKSTSWPQWRPKLDNERLLDATVTLAEGMHVIELGEDLARTLSELLRGSGAKKIWDRA